MASQPCVFVVEDDEALRDSLGMVIELAGIRYKLFDSLDGFLENYDSTPGCLLLDLDLHKNNGLEIATELSKRNSRLHVIFLIAYGFPFDFIIKKVNTASFLTKPVCIESLIDTIKTSIKQSSKN